MSTGEQYDSERPSEREMRKTKQAIRIMDSSKPKERSSMHKTHKRKASCSLQANVPPPRKLLKGQNGVETAVHDPQNSAGEQGIDSESVEAPDKSIADKCPPHVRCTQKSLIPNEEDSSLVDKPPSTLNPLYGTLEKELFNHILTYSFTQSYKNTERQKKQPNSLQDACHQILPVRDCSTSLAALHRVAKQFQLMGSQLKDPFARSHKDFILKHLKPQFLFQK